MFPAALLSPSHSCFIGPTSHKGFTSLSLQTLKPFSHSKYFSLEALNQEQRY